jgi:lysophospholipid acyltransferase (LPLAT)-like uncharacterized protein
MRLTKTIIIRCKENRVLSFLSKNAVYWLMRFLFLTYRLEIKGYTREEYAQMPLNGVCYFWHQHIIAGTFFFFKSGMKGACIVSPSNDGKIAGFVCNKLGFHVLYGSSHKKSITVVRNALDELRQSGRLCLIGDGSRGPAFKLQRGVKYLAEKTKRPLIFIECKTHWAFTFKKSWDLFKLPIPGSKISVIIHKPVYIHGGNHTCMHR